MSHSSKRSREDSDPNDQQARYEKSKKTTNYPNLSKNKISDTPQRSGIGLDTDEWEAPERLSTNIRRTPSISSAKTTLASNTPLTHTSTENKEKEWDNPTPLRALSSDSSSSVMSSSLSSKSRTVLNSKLLERLGYNINPQSPIHDEDNMIDIEKRYDPKEEDEEFDRDFYLSEEGLATGVEGYENSRFLGNPEKFKEREQLILNSNNNNNSSNNKGSSKIAGLSARQSQLHADQEAW